jgi:hypothetical protein
MEQEVTTCTHRSNGHLKGCVVGSQVEHYSCTLQRWVPARVVAVSTNGTYNLDCKPSVTADRIRFSPLQPKVQVHNFHHIDSQEQEQRHKQQHQQQHQQQQHQQHQQHQQQQQQISSLMKRLDVLRTAPDEKVLRSTRSESSEPHGNERPKGQQLSSTQVISGTSGALSADTIAVSTELLVCGPPQGLMKTGTGVDAATAKANTESSRDEDIATAKYHKLLRMSMPEGAIRHKMKVDGIAEAAIGRFFSEENPATSVSTPQHESESTTDTDITVESNASDLSTSSLPPPRLALLEAIQAGKTLKTTSASSSSKHASARGDSAEAARFERTEPGDSASGKGMAALLSDIKNGAKGLRKVDAEERPRNPPSNLEVGTSGDGLMAALNAAMALRRGSIAAHEQKQQHQQTGKSHGSSVDSYSDCGHESDGEWD